MKTKYIKILTILIGLAGFTSCTDWLTIEPDGAVVSNDFWKKGTDVDAVVNACYYSMLEGDVMERIMVAGELRADNVDIENALYQGDLKKIMDANILPDNDLCKWGAFYSVINICNTVLYYAPKVVDPNFTTSKLNAKLAEALTIRALMYFYLVRIYKDVPFVTNPSITDIQDYRLKKNSENEILDQLEKDLLWAEDKALKSYGQPAYNKGLITRNAIRALLADIYLWRGNKDNKDKYEQCIHYCDLILNDPALKLVKADEQPFYMIFGQRNSTESIFELQFSMTPARNSYVRSYYGSSDKSRGFFCVPEFIAKENTVYKDNDVRKKDYITEKDANNVYHIFKYSGLRRTEQGGQSTYEYRGSSFMEPNWIIYRLTDIMLMKAEAMVQIDKEKDVKAYRPEVLRIVNKIYSRSNPTAADTLSTADNLTHLEMEEMVLLERHRELLFEGKRWFDLMRVARRDKNTDRLANFVLRKYKENQSLIRTKLKDPYSLYMPIHEDELKANPELKQNPYYEKNIK